MPSPAGLLDPHDLQFPDLPPALEGLRLAHLTDLHITRPSARCYQIAEALKGLDVDLILLTGDYMSHPGDESPAYDMLRMMCQQIAPRHGAFAVYGNHDSVAFRRLPPPRGVTMLTDEPHVFDGLPLEIWGCDTPGDDPPDFLTLMHRRQHVARERERDAAEGIPPAGSSAEPAAPSPGRRFRLALCHKHIHLPTLADLGADLVLSGHTHGGQCRLPWRQALVNSTDLPLHLTSGVIRHQDTLAVVSRGLGQIKVNLRVCCPAHLPVYTLRRGGLPGGHSWRMRNVRAW